MKLRGEILVVVIVLLVGIKVGVEGSNLIGDRLQSKGLKEGEEEASFIGGRLQ